jgi:hypothetical protein
MLISKANSRVYPVANRLHPRPSWRQPAKQLQCNRRESVNLAVAAVIQVGEDLVWQFLNRKFARIKAHAIGLAGVIDQSRVAQAKRALLRNEAGAAISEAINVTLHLRHRLRAQFVGGAQIRNPGRMSLSNATMATGEGISNWMS